MMLMSYQALMPALRLEVSAEVRVVVDQSRSRIVRRYEPVVLLNLNFLSGLQASVHIPSVQVAEVGALPFLAL